jgi:hypothetical protein
MPREHPEVFDSPEHINTASAVSPQAASAEAHRDDSEADDMEGTTPASGASEQDRSNARRRRLARVPIWVRISVITALVLVGILLSTIVLGASGVGDRDRGSGHGAAGGMELRHDPSDGTQSGGDHGAGGGHTGGDHGSGSEHGSRAVPEPR